MKKDLKERYAKRYLRDGMITIILGLLIFASQVQNLMIQQAPTIDIEELTAGEIKENLKVKMTVTEVLVCYAQTESEEAGILSREYIVPANNYYIGVAGGFDDTIQIDQNLESLIAYVNGDTTTMDQVLPVEIEGTIRKIDSLDMDSYEYCVDELAVDEKEKGKFLEYALYINEVGSAPIEITQIILFAAFIITLLGIYMLYQGCSRRYMRHIIKHCNHADNPEMEKYEIEKLFAGPMDGDYLQVGNERVVLYTENEVKVLDVSNVIWIYEHPLASLPMTVMIPSWLSWIPIFKMKYLVFATKNGKRIKIKVKNDKMMESIMAGLKRNLPYIHFGYSNESDNMYIKNRQEMIKTVDRHKKNWEESLASKPYRI